MELLTATSERGSACAYQLKNHTYNYNYSRWSWGVAGWWLFYNTGQSTLNVWAMASSFLWRVPAARSGVGASILRQRTVSVVCGLSLQLHVINFILPVWRFQGSYPQQLLLHNQKWKTGNYGWQNTVPMQCQISERKKPHSCTEMVWEH